MDSAGRDLQKLCNTAKSNIEINSKVQKWLTDTNMSIDFCESNQCFESDFRTALKCVLNSYHTTEVSVGQFLVQQLDNTERVKKEDGNANEVSPRNSASKPQNDIFSTFYDQDSNGVTPLHIATYRNSLHAHKIANFLLNFDHAPNEYAKDISMASIPMRCGSYPLHILTGQNLTIKEELLETLLRADPSIPFKDDVNGDNPISLLWKNTLRFRWAISVMNGATFIDYIKKDDCSWMAIITPHQFIQYSLRMAGAALQHQNFQQNSGRESVNTIHDLCRIPRCPPMLFRLLQSPEYKAQFGIQGSAYSIDEQGMLPIHHVVQTPPVTYRFVPAFLESQCKKSLVEMLLEEYPESVKIADHNGRLPLHYALESGCVSERDLMLLIQLYPDSLRIEDPKNGLLPFMLVSKNHTRIAESKAFHHRDLENKQEIPGLMCEDTEKDEGAKKFHGDKYQAAWKRDHVKMTYLLLMLCPDAISSNSAFGKNVMEDIMTTNVA